MSNFQHPLLSECGLAKRSMAFRDLFFSLLAQGRIDQVQQRVVLPQAEAKRDRQRHHADDQAGT